MKNLIIPIHILLTMFLLGCADKGVYVGEKKDGKRHGQGILTFSDGSKYEGEYRDDKKHGQGTATFSDGNSYEGEWKDGKQDGKGEYSWSDGRKYVGEWKDGFKTGQGTLTTSFGFDFKYNVHSSLPNDWVNEFYIIMNNLDKVIPVKPTKHLRSLDIFAWKRSAGKPFKNKIGNYNESCFCGNTNNRNPDGSVYKFLVLSIKRTEFKRKLKNTNRYAVIAHEYFHVFQRSLSEYAHMGIFKIKWVSEGTATLVESLYMQQFYDINLLKRRLQELTFVNNPEIFEESRLSREKDRGYSSSVIMVLALVKELKKLGYSEEKAFKLILNDFWIKNPNSYDWKEVFEEVFNITVENFYKSLKNYTNDIYLVLPSESLKLENIFSG